jgi:sulfur carrier protein ThiS
MPVTTAQVTVTRVPGRPVEVVVNGDRTVGEAIAAAEKEVAGYNIQVNGAAADEFTILNDGDRVVLVKPIRGN